MKDPEAMAAPDLLQAAPPAKFLDPPTGATSLLSPSTDATGLLCFEHMRACLGNRRSAKFLACVLPSSVGTNGSSSSLASALLDLLRTGSVPLVHPRIAGGHRRALHPASPATVPCFTNETASAAPSLTWSSASVDECRVARASPPLLRLRRGPPDPPIGLKARFPVTLRL